MELQKTTAIIEAMLFAAAEPVSLRQLKSLLPEVAAEEITQALAALWDAYADGPVRRGVELVVVAGGYRFRTRADVAPWVARLHQQAPLRLSRAMLEVLSIVAYRQPLTRAEIEAVRGVDSGGSLRSLLERDLVRIVGRREMPGRPQLFGTTKTFLEVFGLKSLAELPPLDDELADLQQRLPLQEGALLPPGDVVLAAPEAPLAIAASDEPQILDGDASSGAAPGDDPADPVAGGDAPA